MLTHDIDTSLLRFGSLELEQTSDDGMYVLHTLGKDAGTDVTVAPDPNTTTLISAIQDGAIVATQSFNNIVIPIAVQVLDGPNADPGQGIPLGVAALLAECRKTWYDGLIVPLRWMPSVGFGPPCVWQVTAAKLGEANWDDFNELDPEHRGALYLLELTCGPWAFADGSVTETIPAPTSSSPVTPTVTSIDTCSATTGWSAIGTGATLSTGTDATYGTYVRAQVTNAATVTLRKSGLSINMATSPYLVLQMAGVMKPAAGPVFTPFTPTVKINGTTIAPVAQSGNVYWFPFGGTLNTIDISGSLGATTGTITVTAYDVSRTDMITAGTLTQLQVARQFDVQGSVRTPASIAVRGVTPSTGADAALSQCLVYTTRAQNVATPPLRSARVDGGGDAADATAYSGKKSALSTTHRFQQPVSAFKGPGYTLVARVQASATGAKTLTWTAKTLMGANTVSDVQTGTTTVTIAAANMWQIVTVGLPVLPPSLTGSNGIVEISLSSATLTLDEAWLFDTDNGQLSIGDAGANTHVWLNAASFTLPANTAFVGNAADGSDQYQQGSLWQASEQHEVAPPLVNIFVASGAPAEIGLTYTPASLGRAPKVA